MTNPVADGSFRASEEVVQDGNFVTEEHEAINEMRAHEACATRDKDALTLAWGEKFDWRETRECGVGDGIILSIVDRFALIGRTGASEESVLFCLLLGRLSPVSSGGHVMRTKVEGTEGVDRYLRIEPKLVRAHGDYFFAVDVQDHVGGFCEARKKLRGVFSLALLDFIWLDPKLLRDPETRTAHIFLIEMSQNRALGTYCQTTQKSRVSIQPSITERVMGSGAYWK